MADSMDPFTLHAMRIVRLLNQASVEIDALRALVDQEEDVVPFGKLQSALFPAFDAAWAVVRSVQTVAFNMDNPAARYAREWKDSAGCVEMVGVAPVVPGLERNRMRVAAG